MITTITEKLWNPATKEKYIDTINSLSADMFNNDVYDTYRLALSATEYGKYVSALTSVLKYETMAGVEGVDRGTVARAYGVDTFPVADAVLGDVKGYFFNPMAVVGDASLMHLYNMFHHKDGLDTSYLKVTFYLVLKLLKIKQYSN